MEFHVPHVDFEVGVDVDVNVEVDVDDDADDQVNAYVDFVPMIRLSQST